MKKVLLTLSLAIIVLLGYSQATSVQELRIASENTTVTMNIPVGTKVYCISEQSYWVANTGIVSGWKVDGNASFTRLNESGTDDQGLSFNTGTHAIDIEDGSSAVIPLATNANAGLATGTHIGAIESNTTNISTNATNIGNNSSAISTNATNISGNAGNIATNSTDIGTNETNIATNASNIAGITSNVSTSLEEGTVDGSSYGITSDGGANDVILAAATDSRAGVMTATQFIKLRDIESEAEKNLTMQTEKFEEDDDSATAHPLSQTAIVAQGCIVTLNGVQLAPTKYTFSSSAITIGVPVYQYDQVVISYFY